MDTHTAKSERLTFRLSVILRRRLERHAKKVDRSPSYIINAALEDYLKQHAANGRS